MEARLARLERQVRRIRAALIGTPSQSASP